MDTLKNKLAKYKITNYEILKDGSIDVFQDVNLSGLNLTHIPLRLNKVHGDFKISNNKIKSLKNSPNIVLGSFFCEKNQLESLEHISPTIADSLYCYGNSIKSLEFCPDVKKIDCSLNKLTNLKGVSQKLSCLYAQSNQLETLEGCPPTLFELNCSYNCLTSFKGGPTDIYIRFLCQNNKISSLEGFPTFFEVGYFNCSNNELTEFNFTRRNFSGNFVCSNNKFKSFKGFHEYIDGDFICENNKIDNLEFFPKVSGKITFDKNINTSQFLINNLSLEEQVSFVKNSSNAYKKLKNIDNSDPLISKSTVIGMLEEKINILNLMAS
jgi:hypothetical protein